MCQSDRSCPLDTSADSTRVAPVSMATPTSQPNYSVYTWDHELEKWYARDRRATKWQLRRWLRTLYAESWDRVSILIKRNE